MDSAASSSPAAPEGETPNQRQARLRRERRQAKLQAGGSDRLKAITGLNGRNIPEPDETGSKPGTLAASSSSSLSSSSTTKSNIQSTSQDAPDPDEIVLSDHHYTPRATMNPGPSGNQPIQFPPSSSSEDANEDDPMMKLLQQMLGGASGGGLGGGQQPGTDGNPQLPPGLAEMLGRAQGLAGGQQQAQAEPASSSAYVWRIVHAIFALLLALYVTATSNFTGSKSARTIAGLGAATSETEFRQRLFFWFATVEVVLQSSRYFIEKGQLPPSGLLGGLASMIPEPHAGYVRMFGRYSVIFKTLFQDALIVVFVMGAMAWWNGMVEV